MKKIVVMLLALVMVFGLAAPALALELEAQSGLVIGGGSAEITPVTPDAGSIVNPAGFSDQTLNVVVKCDCGTSNCSAYVEIWQGDVLKETVTSAKASAYYNLTTGGAVTLKAFDGNCGKSFTKWSGTSKLSINGSGDSEVTVTTAKKWKGMQTATANFSSEPAVKGYKITFNGGDGGKINGVTGSSTFTTERIEAGTDVNLATAFKSCSGYKGNYYKPLSSDYSTNYRQIGWNTQKDGKGTHYDMDETITMFDADTTLYAEWEGYEWIHWNVTLGQGGETITHHINGSIATYDGEFKMYCGNSGNSYGKVTKAYYTPVEVTASEDWEFAGWYDGETLISDNAKLTSTAVDSLRKLTLAESGAVLEARFNHTTCKEHLEFVKTIDEPTCTEVGHDLYKCSVCDVEYTVEVPALGHSLLSGWIHNREEHWHKCTRCGELLDVAEHSFTEWTSVYGETNKEERHCTVCSYSEVAETVKINANGSSSKPVSSEENPNTGAEVPSVLPAIAVLAVAAVVLGKKR